MLRQLLRLSVQVDARKMLPLLVYGICQRRVRRQAAYSSLITSKKMSVQILRTDLTTANIFKGRQSLVKS